VREAREREQQAMLDYLGTDSCRMRFQRDQLDDPEATECGRCDNCGAATVSTSVSEQAAAAAHERLARPGVVVEPRKMWPTALANLGIELKGKIAEPPLPGRAVARLTDLGYGQHLRDLFREGTPDGPVPVPLVTAVIEVLGDWRPRATSIVYVESARRPTLTRDFADGLSRYLRVPVAGRFAIADHDVAPGQGRANSAQRVAAVLRRFRLEAEVPEGPVLLLDDLVASGWTVTVAARALRAAGASDVLPLVLGTET
jgi:ATP-dependent DNA helicase RecQ